MTKVNAEAAAPGEARWNQIERIGRGFSADAPVGRKPTESASEAMSPARVSSEANRAGSGVIEAQDGERRLQGAPLSQEDRDALSQLFVDRTQNEKEAGLPDQRFWERLLHSGSFDAILESILTVRTVPQDMWRGRLAMHFKEQIAAILGEPGAVRAETWCSLFLTAIGSDWVIGVLSSARPAAKARYLLERVLLCRHLGLNSEIPFRFVVRGKGEFLNFELTTGLDHIPAVRLVTEGLTLEPAEVLGGAGGLSLVFKLPPSLDAARAIFGSLVIGEPEAPAFPNVAFRLNRTAMSTKEGARAAEDGDVSARPMLVRAGRYLFSESSQIRIQLGTRELAPEGGAGEGAIWRLARAQQVDANRRVRVLTADRNPLWSGTWSEIPEYGAIDRPLEGERIEVGMARLSVALHFNEEEAVEFVVDGLPLPGLSPLSVEWSKSFVRTLVFETPLVLMDGVEHRLAVRIQAADETREFERVVRIAPTREGWASLFEARETVPLVRALSGMGLSRVVDEVLLSHGEGFSLDVLTDILLVRLADEGGEGLSLPMQDAFAALWLRMAKRPRGLEHLARRILATLPKAAASEEWRIIAQMPLKEALVDLAVFLHQISDATGVRLATDIHTHLARLGRHALANQVPRNLSADDQASPEMERVRLRNLRRLWDGEAVGLASDMFRRKVKSPDVQRVLVDHLVQEGRYLEAAAISTETQGISRLLSRSPVHRRMARDAFPLGWVQWARPAFEGANDDAESTLSRLARAQTPSVDASLSIFFTSPAADRAWPHRYFNEIEPAPALAMAAPGEACGALPATTEWTLILHAGALIAPQSINAILSARLDHEDLIVIHQGAGQADAPLTECGFLVRTRHLQFVARMQPRGATSVLSRNLRHRNILVAREARPA